MRLIILAAGQGTRLRPLTNDHPKCLTKVAGKPILARQLELANSLGIDDICVVGGYKIETLFPYPATIIENPDFNSTNMLYSLFCAENWFDKDVIISYGDILYTEEILTQMRDTHFPITVAVDKDWHSYWAERFDEPLDDAESLKIENGYIAHIGQKVSDVSEIQGQYIGLLAFKNIGLDILRESYKRLKETHAQDINKMAMTDFLQHMINFGHAIKPIPIYGNWLEIDSMKDLAIAEQRIQKMNVTEVVN